VLHLDSVSSLIASPPILTELSQGPLFPVVHLAILRALFVVVLQLSQVQQSLGSSLRQPSGHCAVTYSLFRRRVAQPVKEPVSPDCTASSFPFTHHLGGQIDRASFSKIILCCKRRTLHLAYTTSGTWGLAAPFLRQVHSGTNRRPWHPIHTATTNLAASLLPAQ
jgi:hypothetical protein